jgi:tripartite-type tricarboxylate transporter receptor subunit TctC
MTNTYTACFVRNESPVKSFEDTMKIETTVAATSVSSSGAVLSHAFNELIGTKFRVIQGYKAAGDMMLAVERGEVDGMCLAYATMLAANPAAVEQKKVTWLVLVNDKPLADLPGVPLITKFIRSEEGRQIVQLLVARNLVGRPFVLPQGVPEDRTRAMRKAFLDTLNDPQFLGEAKRLKLEIDPMGYAEVEALISAAYETPSAIVDKAYSIMGRVKASDQKAPGTPK